MTSELQLNAPTGIESSALFGTVFRSVYDTQEEILTAIMHLHCQDGFECDMTYGNGCFWKKLPRPRLCYDITPLHEGVIKACSTMLPLAPGSLANCVFDPPFLTYVRNGREHNGKVAMTSRFGGYYRYDELEDHYRDTISEAYPRWPKSKASGWLTCSCCPPSIGCPARRRDSNATLESSTATFWCWNVIMGKCRTTE